MVRERKRGGRGRKRTRLYGKFGRRLPAFSMDRRAISRWQKPVMASSLFSSVNKTLLMYQPSNPRPHSHPLPRLRPRFSSPFVRRLGKKNGEGTQEGRYFHSFDNLISRARSICCKNLSRFFSKRSKL